MPYSHANNRFPRERNVDGGLSIYAEPVTPGGPTEPPTDGKPAPDDLAYRWREIGGETWRDADRWTEAP